MSKASKNDAEVGATIARMCAEQGGCPKGDSRGQYGRRVKASGERCTK